MADLDLRVDYQDDILDSSVNTKRKYNIIENADGTKSLEDVSVYTQNGDSFGAVDINKTNQAILDLNQSLQSFSKAHEALVESLAYSGLGVTEDMTFMEICAVLADKFPAFFHDYIKEVGSSFISIYSPLTSSTNWYNISDTSDTLTFSTDSATDKVSAAHGIRTKTITNTSDRLQPLISTIDWYYSIQEKNENIYIKVLNLTNNTEQTYMHNRGNSDWTTKSGTVNINYNVPVGHSVCIEVYVAMNRGKFSAIFKSLTFGTK